MGGKTENKVKFADLVFSGDKKLFVQWREDITAHLKQASLKLKMDAVKACHAVPIYEYTDLLIKEVVLPEVGENATEEDQRKVQLQILQVEQMEWYLRSLFNQTLPALYRGQLPKPVNEEKLPLLWRATEIYYGQSGARGMVDLLQEFEALMGFNFESVRQLFSNLNSVRNRVNALAAKTLGQGVHLIPSQTMLLRVLFLLPSEYWGSSVSFSKQHFTQEKVIETLCNVIGDRNKAQILAMDRAAANHVQASKGKGKAKKAANSAKSQQYSGQKRKATEDPDAGQCYYCRGQYNEGNSTHFKTNCPKRIKDHANGIFRRDIFTDPNASSTHKRPSKAPVNAVRKEVMVDSATVKKFSKKAAVHQPPIGRPDYVSSPEVREDDSDGDNHSQHSDLSEFHHDDGYTGEIHAAAVRVEKKTPLPVAPPVKAAVSVKKKTIFLDTPPVKAAIAKKKARDPRVRRPVVLPPPSPVEAVDLSGDTVMDESKSTSPSQTPRPVNGDRCEKDDDATMEDSPPLSEPTESGVDDVTMEDPAPPSTPAEPSLENTVRPKETVVAAVARAVNQEGGKPMEPEPAQVEGPSPAKVDNAGSVMAEVAEKLNELTTAVEEKAAATD